MNNKIKTVLFASLIVAMILPFSNMGVINATSESEHTTDKVPNKVKQIQKPVESQAEIDELARVQVIADESAILIESREAITHKHTNSDRNITVPEDELKLLEQIDIRLAELTAEFGVIQEASVKLYALSPQDKKQLLDALDIIMYSDIPYFGMGTDSKVGALVIGFKTQEIADANISKIEQLISVPYYINIPLEPDVDASCKNIDSNCDPLMGGVQITTQYNSTHNLM